MIVVWALILMCDVVRGQSATSFKFVWVKFEVV